MNIRNVAISAVAIVALINAADAYLSATDVQPRDRRISRSKRTRRRKRSHPGSRTANCVHHVTAMIDTSGKARKLDAANPKAGR